MSIVITVPEELKFMAPVINKYLMTVAQLRGQTVAQRSGRSVNYKHVEGTVAEGTAELERATHQGLLQELDVDAPRLLIRGKTYERVQRTDGNYYTLAG